MMEYEVFKNVITSRIKEFLPPLYDSFNVSVHRVPKINGSKDAMILELSMSDRRLAAPNVYLDDMYREFQECGDLDIVLDQAATLILNFTGLQDTGADLPEISDYKGDIVKMLINTEKNEELLANAPHREFLDLSVIYRLAVEDGNGFATVLITNDLLEEMKITLAELDELASENTERKLPSKVVTVTENAAVMTSEFLVYGAVNMLRTETLKKVADDMEDDLYLIPGSVHELMVIKAGGADLKHMREVLREGNRKLVDEDEFLSDNIYFFDRGKNEVMVAE